MSSSDDRAFNNSERRKKRKAEQGRKTSAISGEKCEQAEEKRTDDA